MDDKLKRNLTTLDMLARIKKAGMLNPLTGRMLLYSHVKGGLTKEFESLETALTVRQLFGSPFGQPDASVDGPIRFALTENGIPIGVFPEECHFLIAGSTGSGKTKLMKLIALQALYFNKVNGHES